MAKGEISIAELTSKLLGDEAMDHKIGLQANFNHTCNAHFMIIGRSIP